MSSLDANAQVRRLQLERERLRTCAATQSELEANRRELAAAQMAFNRSLLAEHGFTCAAS